VTESFSPGTLNSDRKFPPKILVTGELVVMVPDDRVIACFCFGPTSSHPFSFPDAEPAMLALSLVGDAGAFVGVAVIDVVFDKLACMT
jgi:hypothetical protein